MKTPTNTQPTSDPRLAPRASSAWRKGAIALGLLSGGFVLGAVSLASAGGMPQPGDHWRGPRIGMIQHFVRGALENVGATTAQEDKIHDIVATTFTDLDQGKEARDQMRKQVLDLMRAPTIDRAAIEKMRADKIAAIDAQSKKIVGAVLDAAGQLTPDQRVKLAQQAEERMAHPGWGGGWHHGGQKDERGGPARDGGPDHAPDNRGDHG